MSVSSSLSSRDAVAVPSVVMDIHTDTELARLPTPTPAANAMNPLRLFVTHAPTHAHAHDPPTSATTPISFGVALLNSPVSPIHTLADLRAYIQRTWPESTLLHAGVSAPLACQIALDAYSFSVPKSSNTIPRAIEASIAATTCLPALHLVVVIDDIPPSSNGSSDELTKSNTTPNTSGRRKSRKSLHTHDDGSAPAPSDIVGAYQLAHRRRERARHDMSEDEFVTDVAADSGDERGDPRKGRRRPAQHSSLSSSSSSSSPLPPAAYVDEQKQNKDRDVDRERRHNDDAEDDSDDDHDDDDDDDIDDDLDDHDETASSHDTDNESNYSTTDSESSTVRAARSRAQFSSLFRITVIGEPVRVRHKRTARPPVTAATAAPATAMKITTPKSTTAGDIATAATAATTPASSADGKSPAALLESGSDVRVRGRVRVFTDLNAFLRCGYDKTRDALASSAFTDDDDDEDAVRDADDDRDLQDDRNNTAGTDASCDVDKAKARLRARAARSAKRKSSSAAAAIASATTTTPTWICVENANFEQCEALGAHFDLHPLTIEDCQTRHTREKLEIFQHYLFVVFHALQHESAPSRMSSVYTSYSGRRGRRLTNDHDVMKTIPIKLIVFPNLVVTFAPARMRVLAAVRDRLRRMNHNLVQSTTWLIHAMLDCLTDALLPVVEGTMSESDALEALIDELTGSEHRDLLRRMSLNRRRLTFLRQRLWSKRDILMSLIGKDWQAFLTDVQVPYLRDVYDHIVTMLHKVEASTLMLNSLQTTYLANVSIDISDQGKQSNEIMKNMSAVATIVLPLSLIAGIMGMNVTVPFMHGVDQQTFESLMPFTFICLGMVIVGIVMFVYFRRKRLM